MCKVIHNVSCGPSQWKNWVNVFQEGRCFGKILSISIVGCAGCVIIVVNVAIIVVGIAKACSKIKASIMHCCCQVKYLTFISTVQVATNLGFIILVIARSSRVFDFGDMCIFGPICRPLDGYATGAYTGYNTLQELEFGNVPVVDGSILLTTMGLCSKDSIFVSMEL